MAKSNPYFPCDLVEQDNDYSIVCSHFHFFDDHFGDKEIDGYSVERLAKKLVRQNAIKEVKFDSEAGMFCAYSGTKGSLKKLCTQLRKITGGEKKLLAARQISKTLIALPQAERLLIKGFVTSLDKLAQDSFLKSVPCPALSKQQSECIWSVQNGTDAEKKKAANKINSEARTLVRDWNHYLSHPSTTKTLLDCCDATRNSPAVLQEIVWALVFICERHLPDRRAEPYFRDALEDRKSWMRCLGLMGLYSLCILTPEQVKPLRRDKSAKVRETAKEHLNWIESSAMKFPTWMFDSKNVGP